jgi:uncharacterized membrane protein
VRFPRPDVSIDIGFVTGARLDAVQKNTRRGRTGQGLRATTTPMPTSGYLVYVRNPRSLRVAMTVEEG